MVIEAGGAGRAGGSGGLSGAEALEAFLGLAAMNIALFASLSDADRAVALAHPEYGSLTVDWIIHQMAGHQIHHLAQLEQIARTQNDFQLYVASAFRRTFGVVRL